MATKVNTPVDVRAFINGEHVSSTRTFKRENPAHPDEIVGSAPSNTREETRAAIEAAAQAFPAWSKTPIAKRAELLGRAAAKLGQNIPEWKQLLTREHGKVLWDAEGELGLAAMLFAQGTGMAGALQMEQRIEDERGRLFINRQPIGVVSAITPWNYPVVLALMKVMPALLTGNTMVLKPSPFAPLTISKVATTIAEELPAGVLNLVHGFAEVGEELTTNPKVGKIAFTGSGKTATHIMRSASDTIKKVTFELGGNDPAIFLEDADLSEESMRKLVVGTFLTTGQICMAAKRIYVHESIYRPFLDAFRSVADQWLRIGDGFHPDATVGPLNNKGQKEYVEGLVEDARHNGAEVIPVGKILDEETYRTGYFLQPTIITGASHTDRIVTEEQFGPTVPVLTYKTEEEAVKLANDTVYGLTASVWSQDEERALRVAQQMQAGSTWINTHSLGGLDPRAPFGGCKQSGIGVEMGVEGFLEYTEFRVINAPTSGVLPGVPV